MAVLSAGNGFGLPQGGTIGYMPPEQIELSAVDERTDLWAFTILLYQLLVGRNPYLVAGARESLELIETLVSPLPAAVRDDLDPEIDRLFISALSADRSLRPTSIREFSGVLLPFLGSARRGRSAISRLISLSTSDEPDNTDEFDALSVRQSGVFRQSGAHFIGQTADNDIDTDGDETDDDGDEKSGWPFWLTLTEKSQKRWQRFLAVLAAATTAFVGLSGFGVFGLGGGGVATKIPWHPVGGSLESQFDLRSVVLSTSDLQAQAVVVLGVLALTALVTMIAPPLGGALAVLIFTAGLYARGLVVLGTAFLVIAVLWWLFLGRRGWTESLLITLTVPLSAVFCPFSLPIFAGGTLKPTRALGTMFTSWLVLLFASGLTGSDTAVPILEQFFGSRLILVRATQQFPAVFWEIIRSPAIWVYLLVWLAATVLMLVFARRQKTERLVRSGRPSTVADSGESLSYQPSRLILAIGAVLATVLQTLGLVVVPLLGNTATHVTLTTVSVVRIAISLTTALVVIRLGIIGGWSAEESMPSRSS
jgi:hypothetical protein